MTPKDTPTSSSDGSLTVKDIYAEIGLNYRYFLTWRHSLFAGYLVVLAALSVAGSWFFKEARGHLWLVPLVASILTVVFWMIERRNRDLYRTCLDRGAACEKALAACGIFTGFKSPPPSRFTQSFAIDLLFAVVLLLLVSGSVIVAVKPSLLTP